MPFSKYFNLDSPGTDANGEPIPPEEFTEIVTYLESLSRKELWNIVYPVVKYVTKKNQKYEDEDDPSYPTDMLISDYLHESTRAEYQELLKKHER